MSTPDEAARESARQGNGQFGTQERSEAEGVDLGDVGGTDETPAVPAPSLKFEWPPATDRKPRPAPDAKPQVVKVPGLHGSDPAFQVTLRARDSLGLGTHSDRESWEVYGDQGVYMGTVTKYIGSINRRIPNGGRHLRAEGKKRTLWEYDTPAPRNGSMSKQANRAHCLRSLRDENVRRQAGEKARLREERKARKQD